MSLYIGSTAQVMAQDGLSPKFPVEKGVLQGDTLAPYLFVIALDRVLKRALDGQSEFGFLLKKRECSRSPELRIKDLDFSDDLSGIVFRNRSGYA